MSSLSRPDAQFSDRVAKVRQFRGLTQQQLADQIGVRRNAITDIERRKRFARLGEAVAIARVLQVPLPDLYGDEPLNVTPEPVRVA